MFYLEYSSILFMSMIFVVMFMGSNMLSLFFYFKLVFIAFSFLWVRGTLPRYRYDKLMYLAWKSFLPISLNYFMLYLGLKIFFVLFYLVNQI